MKTNSYNLTDEECLMISTGLHLMLNALNSNQMNGMTEEEKNLNITAYSNLAKKFEGKIKFEL